MMSLPKKLGVALFLSLGLNLFFGGAIAMHVLGRRTGQGFGPGRGFGPGGPGGGGGRGAALGPPEVRVIRDVVRVMGGPSDPRIRQHFIDARQERREVRARMDAAHDAVRAALAADPFDPARLDQALAALDAETRSAQGRARQKLTKLGAALTPNERRALRESQGPLFSPPPED